MTGKEIRSWAWEKAKGNRLFLIAVYVISAIPGTVVEQASKKMGQEISLVIRFPVMLLTCLLLLGSTAVALELADSGERKFSKLWSPFQNGRFAKALTIAGVNTILQLLPLTLPVSLITSLLGWTLLFPQVYLLLLASEKSILELWKDGLSIGWHRGKELLCFNFLVQLPLLAGAAAIVVLVLALLAQAVGLLIPLLLIFVIFIYWYLPYMELAQAKKGMEILCPGVETMVEKGE